MLRADTLFEVPKDLPFGETFRPGLSPWAWVGLIRQALSELEPSDFQGQGKLPAGCSVSGAVWIHPSVKLPPFCSITGPVYLGEGCEVRPGAYLRGYVIAGKNCVLGNSSEFKNCLLLDGAQVPHFSYVGDSVLGNGAHLGAGVICSNLRLDQHPVPVVLPDGTRTDSGMRKLGALIGDGAEVGCNAVLNPGSILGRRSLVMPGLAFRGALAEGMAAYHETRVDTKPRGE
jgi:NDP-sugar pyrophosphorylase family protein